MSHVACSKGTITDIDALEKAVARIPGAKFVRNKKSYKWYGHWENDWHTKQAAYKRGIDVDQYGKCDHVISIKDAAYEVGVVKRKDGTGWSLVWDKWKEMSGAHLIDKAIGNEGQKLMALYAEEYCRKYAEEHGATIETTELEDDMIKIELITI